MKNKDKFHTVIAITLGAILVTQGISSHIPWVVVAGACIALLFPTYYCLGKKDEGPEEDDEFSVAELQEMEEGLERLKSWAYVELESGRPVIYDYKYLHRAFETTEEYRDFLGWLRESMREWKRALEDINRREANLDGGLKS